MPGRSGAAYCLRVRTVGDAGHAGGLGINDHLSWTYDDRHDFVQRVQEFLTDGLALGLRCVYAADRPAAQLEADLAAIPDLRTHLDRGDLTLTSLEHLYATGSVLDPAQMRASIAAETEDALTQGYAGLRVVADATALVRTPEQLSAFAAWEHTADRFMATHPLSGMCGFDGRQLSESAASVLACLHPAARAGTAPFGVFAPGERADLGLWGELDRSVLDDFRACLERTGLDAACELVVDGSRLAFVDHRGLESIRDFASGLGATAVLRTASSLPARLVALLGLEGIRVESAPAAATAPA